MQGFAPADEALLFRQKCPKPFPPVRGPMGVPPPPPRIRWFGNSLRSNSPHQSGRFGAAAPPHPKARRHSKNKIGFQTAEREGYPFQNTILIPCVILVFAFHCVGSGWAAAPNPTSRRALSERSELRSHHDSGRWTRHPQGRARAKMVLVPFAETKGTRRAGAKPRIIILGKNPAWWRTEKEAKSNLDPR